MQEMSLPNIFGSIENSLANETQDELNDDKNLNYEPLNSQY